MISRSFVDDTWSRDVFENRKKFIVFLIEPTRKPDKFTEPRLASYIFTKRPRKLHEGMCV